MRLPGSGSACMPQTSPKPAQRRSTTMNSPCSSAADTEKKLKRGGLLANHFSITVRDVVGDTDGWFERVHEIAKRGVPNYFGPQRFGHDGGNLARAAELLEGRRRRVGRHQRGLYLSAARAYVFNGILARRVVAGNWDQAIAGDLLMLDGRHSCFPYDVQDVTLAARLGSLDVHPSGLLPGADPYRATDWAGAFEQAVVDDASALCEGLVGLKVEAQRRALRLRVADLQARKVEGGLAVEFRLTRGAFATVVLRELLAPGPQ